MQAKRRQTSIPQADHAPAGVEPSPAATEAIAEAELHALCSTVQSADGPPRLVALKRLRTVLAGETPPVTAAVRLGVVDSLIRILGAGKEEEALEAGCCLTNIASWDEAATEAAFAAAPIFLTLLQSASVALREQGAWAVGNFAAESEHLRRRLIEAGAIPLTAALLSIKRPVVQARAAWALSNLARGASVPATPFIDSEVHLALPALIAHADNDVATESAWIAAFLSAKGDDTASAMVETGVVAALTQRAPTLPPVALVPVVRALGNIAACVNDRETVDVLHQPSTLPMIASLLDKPPVPQFRREVLWLLANLCASPAEHSVAVVRAGLLAPLCAAVDSGDFAEQREAATAIANLAHSHPAAVIAAGAHTRIVRLLRAPDVALVAAVTEGLHTVMTADPNIRPSLEAAEIIDAFESVQYSTEVPAALGRRCGEVKDIHFGENYGIEEDDEDDDEAATAAAPFAPFGMAGVGAGVAAGGAPTGRGRGAVQPAWMAAAPVGRGRGAVQPAWMSGR